MANKKIENAILDLLKSKYETIIKKYSLGLMNDQEDPLDQKEYAFKLVGVNDIEITITLWKTNHTINYTHKNLNLPEHNDLLEFANNLIHDLGELY
jgi:hypothetical protein